MRLAWWIALGGAAAIAGRPLHQQLARRDFLHTIDFTMQGRVVRSIYLGWTID